MNNFSMLAFSLDVDFIFYLLYIVARFVRAESRCGWFVVLDVLIEFTRSSFVYKTENIVAKMYFKLYLLLKFTFGAKKCLFYI